jgi:hypothetical protein
MQVEQVWNFHDGDTAWAISGDEWSPMFIDLEITLPRFNRTGEVWLWIMCAVAATYGDTDEYYQFIVKSSATNDATNLNGTIYEHIMTPNYVGNDTRVATARSRPFFACCLPGDALQRYIQLYCEVTGTTPTISVYAGLAASKSAIPNIAYLQTVRTNVVAPS